MASVKENTQERFLDTKGTCFLCLINPKNIPRQESIEKNKVHLSSLCKYLNISPSTVLRGLEGNSGGNIDFHGDSQCKFSVILCFHCATIVNKLDALKGEQEIVRMQFEHYVQKLNQILEDSEKGKSRNDRWCKLQKKMKRNDPTETRLVEQLRIEMKGKCALKLQEIKATSFSKVLLNRISIPAVTNNETVALNWQKDVQKVHHHASNVRNEASGEVDQDLVNIFQSLGMPLSLARSLSIQV